ncbi:F0F1 ATP synthase subunit C [Lentilactobacillus kribbianus]|uniref:F0F1 ATP synthase subunit C n=1 Tax=Lentilactobacillus kribbianus TaxID=2729622 RepID=UPI001556CCCA|nr:F0F1 ATP synthase subunit C [Lentilactobacillus kribbianus]
MGVFATAIVMIGAAIGACFGDAIVISKTLEGMTRQPEMAGQLRTTMFIGVGLVESMPILSFVIALLLMNK